MSRFETYDSLMQLETYEERLQALSLVDYKYDAPIDRHGFYKTRGWMLRQREVVARDLGLDIGVEGMYINDRIIVHHIDPLLQNDLDLLSDKCFDMNRLITVSIRTHNNIHYGTPVVTTFKRKPGDTKLW